MLLRVTGYIAVASCAAMFRFQALAAEPQIRWGDQYVEAIGIDTSTVATNLSLADWQRIFAVRAQQSGALSDIGLPPVFGSYEVVSNAIRFTPQFPFQPNVTYNAILRPSNLPNGSGPAITQKHIIVSNPIPNAEVAAIYPSTNRLPDNLLKFYIHFSAPMSGGHIYDHIHLRDIAANKMVELPFLEIDEELWDPAMRRLTLFLDPGRIKRGVRPLEEIGPSFYAGKTYALTISSNWLDANGAPLKKSFEKIFTVVASDREPPDPTKWQVIAPKAGTTNAVTLRFEKPLDHAIATRTISIGVPGQAHLAENETRWIFEPAAPWKPGPYEIKVPTRIEDMAGNIVGKPFDLDLQEKKVLLTNTIVTIPFTIR
jgi:hypothetical protein